MHMYTRTHTQTIHVCINAKYKHHFNSSVDSVDLMTEVCIYPHLWIYMYAYTYTH